ncbi:MAG TPA: HAD family hydrolase [Vicinamibacterales bacterium]|nr:HAD family hydrolase [Vicinamibacterales bacterium]
MADTEAVFFDVDFTLIRPGPRFLGEGYAGTCASHGVQIDAAAFDAAVAGAADVLESAVQLYHDDLFVNYTSRIIKLMGGTGPGVALAAREIYDDWAQHHHFELYDDVPATLVALRARGLKLGLISNSHRCLKSFQSHFELEGLMSVTVSSAEFGVMKPDPRIFLEALDRMDVPASRAVMVGDSLAHDVMGARQAGMRAVLLDRGGCASTEDPEVTVIRSLRELSALV